MTCCLCPEGECPPDCHFLEVFPIESPFKTPEELSDTGFKLEFIKECLLKAKTPDEQKTIVRGMVIEKARWDLALYLSAAGSLWEEAGISSCRIAIMKAVLDGTLPGYFDVSSEGPFAFADGTPPPPKDD